MVSNAFVEGESPIHRLDPRVKILGAAGLSVVLALRREWLPLYLGLAFGGGLTLLARLPFFSVLKRLLAVNGFLLFLWATLPFTTPGAPIFHLPHLVATREGLDLALAITIKSNAVVLVLMALLSTSSLTGLAHALHHLRLPRTLVQVFAMSVRYLDLLGAEYARMNRAMKARGFVPRSGTHTYRSFAYALAMLLVRSVERAESVHRAMLCRGFTGDFYAYIHFSMAARDWTALAVLSGFCILLAGA